MLRSLNQPRKIPWRSWVRVVIDSSTVHFWEVPRLAELTNVVEMNQRHIDGVCIVTLRGSAAREHIPSGLLPNLSVCFGSATIERNTTNAGNLCQNRLEPPVTCKCSGGTLRRKYEHMYADQIPLLWCRHTGIGSDSCFLGALNEAIIWGTLSTGRTRFVNGGSGDPE